MSKRQATQKKDKLCEYFEFKFLAWIHLLEKNSSNYDERLDSGPSITAQHGPKQHYQAATCCGASFAEFFLAKSHVLNPLTRCISVYSQSLHGS